MKESVNNTADEKICKRNMNTGFLHSEVISEICRLLSVKRKDVTEIVELKKGMTNRSFVFCCKGQKFIIRIPGKGTTKLINRKGEADVYEILGNERISDKVIYLNPDVGYKIAIFHENARTCNPYDYEDVKKCMRFLKAFHEKKMVVSHEFDIFSQLDFYESLWNGKTSVYSDYENTKKEILSLKSYIDAHTEQKVLTHIDAIPDNFLFIEEEDGEHIRLIDWEYAGMQDPHVDIAMFCIYSLYDRQQVDLLISTYFTEGCTDETRIKIYCYIAVCGLLWSNWCEYKHHFGIEFGEYSLRQYQYAKEYYQIVQEERMRIEGSGDKA